MKRQVATFGGIKVVWLEFDNSLYGELLFRSRLSPENETLRQQWVREIVEPRPGEAPLDAWLRYLAEINGLPDTELVHPALAEAIRMTPAWRFMWLLA